MSEAENRPTNFIRHIIDADLESGKHSGVQTRFRLSQMVIYILVMPNPFV